MKVSEVLRLVVDQLGSIPVPVNLSEQITDPIKGCIHNIQLCADALEQSEADAENNAQNQPSSDGADASEKPTVDGEEGSEDAEGSDNELDEMYEGG